MKIILKQHIEPGEEPIDAARRELYEETNIASDEIQIKPLFFSQYFEEGLELQVYYGFLNQDVNLISEVNPLYWVDIDSDFSDTSKYAGDGNIAHMISVLKSWNHL